MDAATKKRIEAERARAALSAIGASAAKAVTSFTSQTLPERTRRKQAQGLGLAPARTSHSNKATAVEKSIPHLLPPAPTAEALSSPARRRAEADGFAQFGKRTWLLVERGGKFRAVESLDDASGWGLVKEMKR